MTRNEIIEKLKKVRALANNGTDGEMGNAQARLEELMRKYSITDKDLEEKESVDFYMIDANEQTQLAVQIIHTFFSPKMKIYDIRKMKRRDRKLLFETDHGSSNGNIAIESTKSDFLQIVFLYETYLEDYKKQLAAFEYAYYSANNLLPKAPTDGIEAKEIPDEVVEQAAEMQYNIRKKVVRKALDAAESNTKTSNSNQYAIDY